ncbi:enoyl-CoA hydratase/isomerase family protein [Hymenobacter volaticus]|uniref:Enoyl-CoA hydratase/isomerase family protein n=1 Tax=Hymenobacter volaticus TaxID=2932254 RepID=A0ABY4GDS6_9BACT|nr:enoyl-CoA hydratase/isomerase family protein [Hymenobacter volaticus]UOQ69003.1 enoyl-CoA hydratase/isomerase family protein [Hymenobacter volaticus]
MLTNFPVSPASSYQDYQALRIVLDQGVATVTIAHPPLNVLDIPFILELMRFTATVRADEQVRVIVLESADPEFFIAHGDMHFITNPALIAGFTAVGTPSPLNPMQELHEQLRTLPQVTMAKIAGLARGGGNELLMALDMRFAAIRRTGLAQPEVLMGIIPGGGGTQYLTRLIGAPRALEAILGATLFDAELAERYGWINRALPAEELDEFVAALARRIAALPVGVAAAAKAAVQAAALTPLQQGLATENTLMGGLFQSPAAFERTSRALAAGAQTRAGERDLEGLFNTM